VVALPDHLPPWSGLWAGVASSMGPDPSVSLVVTLSEKPGEWHQALNALFPNARVVVEAGTLDRVLAGELASRFAGAAGVVMHGELRAHHDGQVVLHAGSGGLAKQWPLRCWIELSGLVARAGYRATLIAGEAERDRWADDGEFVASGGRYIDILEELAAVLSPAMAMVGADCGPAHLAGQLGVPTLSLFGPTSPERWAPIGPRVRVLRSADGTMMSIGSLEVIRNLARMLAEEQQS
jgi:hypothetical protein